MHGKGCLASKAAAHFLFSWSADKRAVLACGYATFAGVAARFGVVVQGQGEKLPVMQARGLSPRQCGSRLTALVLHANGARPSQAVRALAWAYGGIQVPRMFGSAIGRLCLARFDGCGLQ